MGGDDSFSLRPEIGLGLGLGLGLRVSARVRERASCGRVVELELTLGPVKPCLLLVDRLSFFLLPSYTLGFRVRVRVRDRITVKVRVATTTYVTNEVRVTWQKSLFPSCRQLGEEGCCHP